MSTRAVADAAARWVLIVTTALASASVPSDLSAQEARPDTAHLGREIAAERAASNAAFAAGDVAGMLAAIDVDYVGTGGSGGHIRSREELAALFRGIADSPVGLYFVRTPERIEVAGDGARAMEMGRWEGRERREGVEVTTVGGGYTAYWRRVDGRWVIHAELFVTLRPQALSYPSR